MVKKLGLGTRFEYDVPVYVGSTSTTHDAGNRTFSAWVQHVALWYFVHDLVQQERISVHYVKTKGQIVDV